LNKFVKRSYVSVAAVNDSEVLQRNLLMSPDINQGHLRLVECRGFKSASLAYNHGLDTTQEDIVVFVHQDVYLPKGWLAEVDQKILELEQTDPQWAVLGVFGVKPNGQEVGHVWCSGLQRELKTQCDQAHKRCAVLTSSLFYSGGRQTAASTTCCPTGISMELT
jgi:hypothetical protein